jgi:hypothetical protein
MAPVPDIRTLVGDFRCAPVFPAISAANQYRADSTTDLAQS